MISLLAIILVNALIWFVLGFKLGTSDITFRTGRKRKAKRVWGMTRVSSADNLSTKIFYHEN